MKWAIYSCLAFGFLVQSFSAAAASLDGVTVPDQIKEGNQSLVLNGMGTRKVTVFNVKIYVASLYLQTKTKSADEVIDSNQVKKIVLHFVHDAPRKKQVSAWEEGFEKNCKNACDQLKPTLQKLTSLLIDLKENDVFSFTFVGTGVEVRIKEQAPTHIDGKEFQKVLLSVFFGAEPPNASLKQGMLGL